MNLKHHNFIYKNYGNQKTDMAITAPESKNDFLLETQGVN